MIPGARTKSVTTNPTRASETPPRHQEIERSTQQSSYDPARAARLAASAGPRTKHESERTHRTGRRPYLGGPTGKGGCRERRNARNPRSRARWSLSSSAASRWLPSVGGLSGREGGNKGERGKEGDGRTPGGGGGGPARRGGDDVARPGPSDMVPLPRGRSGWRFGPRAVSRAPSAINGGSFFWEWQRICFWRKKWETAWAMWLSWSS
jgi:hypothetical protein